MPEGVLSWILIGLVAGVLGKLIMPGKDPGGVFVTILIGIAGAALAFYLTPLIGITLVKTWHHYAAATVGAVVLLLLYRLMIARRV